MPTIIQESAADADPRFNAVDHGFSGETVLIRPQDYERYWDLNRKFNCEWGPMTETEQTFVDEMVAHKFQMQNIQHAINKLQEEKGDEAILSDNYRLLRRYLNEHRRDFYRAYNAVNSLKKSKEREKRVKVKDRQGNEIRRYAADTNRLSAVVKAYETEYFHANPMEVNGYNRSIDAPPLR